MRKFVSAIVILLLLFGFGSYISDRNTGYEPMRSTTSAENATSKTTLRTSIATTTKLATTSAMTTTTQAFSTVTSASAVNTTIDEPVVATVYITNSGDKYHSAGCQYLRKSQIPISLDKAISSGYTPCAKCNP